MAVPPSTNKSLNESLPEAIRRIAEALRPEKIYLFGSHAWGEATPDSDIDLFVIIKESSQPAYRRSREAYRSLRGIREPFEVIVRTVAEVEKNKSVASSLVKKILEQGKLLYG
ncbi:MAG: nucleotidyltransferase domain-containing protein [Proteobacteria bacterium]|nr:nucleotidyltransferase domain-containing protein [Pseudomonadota bacterium]